MHATTSLLIAIVDDDEAVRCALSSLLKSCGLQPRAFASAEEFLNSSRQSAFGCLIVDVRMGGMSGLELQSRLAQQDCRVPIVFLTAHADSRMRTQAMQSGAFHVLEKPFDDGALIDVIHSALERDQRP